MINRTNKTYQAGDEQYQGSDEKCNQNSSNENTKKEGSSKKLNLEVDMRQLRIKYRLGPASPDFV